MRCCRNRLTFLFAFMVVLSALPEARAQAFVRGDADGNGVLEIDDAVLILSGLVDKRSRFRVRTRLTSMTVARSTSSMR